MDFKEKMGYVLDFLQQEMGEVKMIMTMMMMIDDLMIITFKGSLFYLDEDDNDRKLIIKVEEFSQRIRC